MCKILAGLRRTSLGAHLLPPPSITRCCKASSVVFCVSVCACSASSACPQLHVHHGQERQTLWKKCCNAEKGAYLLGRICAPSLQLESTQVLPFSTYIYMYIYIRTRTHFTGPATRISCHFLELVPSLVVRCSCYKKGWKVSLPRALSQSSDVFCVAFFLSLSLSFSPCVRVQKQLVELPSWPPCRQLSPPTRHFTVRIFLCCRSVPAAQCRCPACPLELQSRCAYLPQQHSQASVRHVLQYVFLYAAVYVFFFSCLSACAIFIACGADCGSCLRRLSWSTFLDRACGASSFWAGSVCVRVCECV